MFAKINKSYEQGVKYRVILFMMSIFAVYFLLLVPSFPFRFSYYLIFLCFAVLHPIINYNEFNSNKTTALKSRLKICFKGALDELNRLKGRYSISVQNENKIIILTKKFIIKLK